MTNVFDDVRMPEDVESGAEGGPSFKTGLIELSSGIEQRIASWDQARASWDVGYGIQNDVEFAEVEAFFFERRGKLRAFRFKDFHDFKGTAQPLGTSNGTKRTYLFYKKYGTTTPYFRRLTRLVAGTVKIYLNGVLEDPSHYDLFVNGGYMRWKNGFVPANGVVITTDYEFDIPVRFDVDDLKLALYWQKAGQVPHLPIVEIRDIINDPPTIELVNTVDDLDEDTDTTAHIRVADVQVNDDPFGENTLSLTGTDLAHFELVGTLNEDGTGVSLYLKAATVLNTDIKSSYTVDVNVTDPSLSTAIADTATYNLTINPVPGPPHVKLQNKTPSFVWNQSTAIHLKVAEVVVTQHYPVGVADNFLSLSGADAAQFEFGTPVSGPGGFTCDLFIKAGTATAPDIDHPVSYAVTVAVSNADFPSPPQDSDSMVVTFGVIHVIFVDDVAGTRTWPVPEYDTLLVDIYGPGGGAPGTNQKGTDGTATSIPSMGLSAAGGKCPELIENFLVAGAGQVSVVNNEGGEGGDATGGTLNEKGGKGGSGLTKKIVVAGTPVTSGAGGDCPNGGAGGPAGTSTAPAAPYSGSPCLGAPPSPYPVPGTQTVVDGADGTGPGGGGAGAASVGWEIVFTLANGYCWTLFIAARPGAGAGSHAQKLFTRGVTPGAPTPGTNLSYTVGTKGAGGLDVANGGDGGFGRVRIEVNPP